MSLGDPLRKLARDAHLFEAQWPTAGARIFEEEASRQAASATGGDGMLSKWRDIGSADTRVAGGPGQATMTAVGGLWKILENGTTPHQVAARGRALSTPYGPRKRVHVRGRAALNSWTRAAQTAEQQLQQATAQAFSRLGG